MRRRKMIMAVVLCLLCTLALGTSAFAANYKFSFSKTTGYFHGAVYTDYATKYTKTEPPVISITENSSGVYMQYTVVNDENSARTDTLNTNATCKHVFTNDRTSKGYRYKVKIKTDEGSFWNRYTVKGGWNIDTY